MHRARQRTDSRNRKRRHRLAHEAAKLMIEDGIRDYPRARLKAAARLGIRDDASWPHNLEIEQALREYQRLFAGPEQLLELHRRRQAALQAMEFFAAFSPRLVGAVLDGTADSHTAVQIHLHSDDPEALPHMLNEHGIPARSLTRRLRMDHVRSADTQIWRFDAEDLSFEFTVLPCLALRQPPLSPLDERPVQRASATQLRQLLQKTHSGTRTDT